MPTASPLVNAAINLNSKIIPTGDQLDIMNMTEEQFTIGSHFSLGVNIRNDLGLWKDDSPLGAWFVSRGVAEPDDMSEILPTCVYRIIRAKNIDLNGQLEKFQG